MKYELSQTFYFEAAHTLQRDIETESSMRVHGHTYHVEVTITGIPDAKSGMIIDISYFKGELNRVRERLDHRLLDEIEGLGPATLENICKFIFESLSGALSCVRVKVSREAAGNSCVLHFD